MRKNRRRHWKGVKENLAAVRPKQPRPETGENLSRASNIKLNI
jgi:hypothetical protein